MRRFYIFLRAFLMISLTTGNVWFISHKFYLGSILISAGISIMFTLNVKDLAIANWIDRIIYASGALLGTSLVLYVPMLFGIK